jgi:hypothetical protein
MKFAKRIGQLWKGLTPILVTGAGFRMLKIMGAREVSEPDYCLIFSK